MLGKGNVCTALQARARCAFIAVAAASVVSLPLSWATTANAEAPSLQAAPITAGQQSSATSAQLLAANAAVRAGFYTAAETLYTHIAQETSGDAANAPTPEFLNTWLQLRVATGKLNAAAALHTQHLNAIPPSVHLFWAHTQLNVAAEKGKATETAAALQAAQAALETYAAANNNNSSNPWHTLLSARLAEANENFLKAHNILETFEKDNAGMAQPTLPLLFESERLALGARLHAYRALNPKNKDDLTAENLLKKKRIKRLSKALNKAIEKDKESAQALPLARALSAAQFIKGETGPALETLQRTLSAFPNLSAEGAQQLHLLAALFTPKGNPARTQALQQLLSTTHNTRYMQFAAWQLTQQAPENASALLSIVKERLAETSAPLANFHWQLLHAYALGLENIEAASAAANALLQHPAVNVNENKNETAQAQAHTLLAEVYFLKLHLALKAKPPAYRLASQHVQNILEAPHANYSAERLNQAFADLLYLAGDTQRAAQRYTTLLENTFSARNTFQLVQCYIALNQLSKAEAALQTLANTPASKHSARSYWNVATAYIQQNNLPAAKNILQMFSAHIYNKANNKENENNAVVETFAPRIQWLQAHIASIEGTPESLQNALALMQPFILKGASAANKTDAAVQNAATKLAAFVYFKQGKANEALALLNGEVEGAENFEHTLLKAHVQAENGSAAQAQQTLTQWANAQLQQAQASEINGQHIATALHYSAVYAWQQGLERTQQTALEQLQRITQLQAPGVTQLQRFSAHTQMGQWLQNSGQFAPAAAMYQAALAHAPNELLSAKTTLAKAVCMKALPSQNLQAESVFERLTDTTSLPLELRAEAAYHWAHNLQQRGEAEKASSVCWLSLNAAMQQASAAEGSISFTAQAQYWLARSALLYTGLMEAAGNMEEAQRVRAWAQAQGLPGA